MSKKQQGDASLMSFCLTLFHVMTISLSPLVILRMPIWHPHFFTSRLWP